MAVSGPAQPLVTVSLVTWNGAAWLDDCLASMATQSLGEHETLVVDNASTDESVSILRDWAARDDRIKVAESDVNAGYARAHNLNILAARGRFVLLLNQDVILDPDFLRAGVAALEAHPRAAAVQGRIRRLGPAGERTAFIDTTGLVMGRDRRAAIRSHRQPDDGRPEITTPGPVWGADGPAPLYRRAALLSARLPRRGGGWEVLDEDFFLLKEDVDLAWRLRRLGWTARYEPLALAWHARSGVGPDEPGMGDIARANMANPIDIRRRSWRNQRLMQVKNERGADFLRDLPWIAWREALELGFMVLVDRPRLAAVPALLAALPGAIRKRRALARRRQSSPAGMADASRATVARLGEPPTSNVS